MASEQSSNIAGAGIVVTVLAVTGALFVFREAPLHGVRPEESEAQLYTLAPKETVEARHWQDPFAAVARALARKSDFPPNAKLPCEENLASELGENTHVLAVMLPGGPYFETSEARRRMRYAVLSGLQSEQFVKDVEDHIGCWKTPEFGSPIPFERFSKGEEAQEILLLWLNEDVLVRDHRPLAEVAKLIDALWIADKNVKVKILGPYSSDTLLGLVREAMHEDESPVPSCLRSTNLFFPKLCEKPRSLWIPNLSADSCEAIAFQGLKEKLSRIVFYAYGATISFDALKQELPHEKAELERWGDITKYMESHGVTLYRTIAEDSILAEAISAELKKRSITPGEKAQVALVGEWDTVYGRTIAPTIAEGLDCLGCDWIYVDAYERGLDGARPSRDGKEEAKPEKESSPEAETAKTVEQERAKAKAEAQAFDRPFGRGQQDYLRRLARGLKDKENKLPGGASIAAIGIVGNDVFDKLLVLRALKPEFPEALFFTTDFDYTFTMPSELGWTRNLIVASSFGPELRKELQGKIPPFRGSYETSAFLATRLAVCDFAARSEKPCSAPPNPQEKIKAWLEHPRIFEIDRSGGVLAFASAKEEVGKKATPNDEQEACANGVWACPSLYPEVQPLYPPLKGLAWTALPLFIILMLLILMRKEKTGDHTQAISKQKRFTTNICDDVSAIRATHEYHFSHRMAELFAILRVSIWTILLYVLSAGMIVYFRPYLLKSVLIGAYIIVWLVGVTFVLWQLEYRCNWGKLEVKGEDNDLGPLPESESTEFVLVSLVLIIAIMVCRFWPSVGDFLTESGAGEAVAFADGVSLWPVILLRLLIFFLAAALLTRALRKVRHNVIDTANYLRLQPVKEVLKSESGDHHAPADHGNFFTKEFVQFKEAFDMSSYSRHEKVPVEVDENLERLVLQGSPKQRKVRLAVYVAVMFAVAFGLAQFLGLPYTPRRSDLAFFAYQIVTFADVFMMFVLLAFVFDAIHVFWRFSKFLGRNATKWPRETKQKYAEELGMRASDPLLDYWIDVDFIAKRTSCLGGLVYYPFAILALVIITRSPVFANFAFNAAIVITIGVGFLILLACAFALRHAAEEARAAARKAITKGIMSEKQGSPRLAAAVHAARAAQLEVLLGRIDSLQEGAFLPLVQQPPVRAVLLPLASVGLTLLTEFGLIPGL